MDAIGLLPVKIDKVGGHGDYCNSEYQGESMNEKVQALQEVMRHDVCTCTLNSWNFPSTDLGVL